MTGYVRVEVMRGCALSGRLQRDARCFVNLRRKNCDVHVICQNCRTHDERGVRQRARGGLTTPRFSIFDGFSDILRIMRFVSLSHELCGAVSYDGICACGGHEGLCFMMWVSHAPGVEIYHRSITVLG